MPYLCDSYDSVTQVATECREFSIHEYGLTGAEVGVICTAIASYFIVCWILNRLQHSVK